MRTTRKILGVTVSDVSSTPARPGEIFVPRGSMSTTRKVLGVTVSSHTSTPAGDGWVPTPVTTSTTIGTGKKIGCLGIILLGLIGAGGLITLLPPIAT